jgi:glycine C-acetyltransferase
LNYWKRHHFKRQIRTNHYQGRNEKAGFDIDGDSAIVPVMLYDAKLANQMNY